MNTLLHMQNNNVQAVGSRAPDVNVILLITESSQITKLWKTNSRHLTGCLFLCLDTYTVADKDIDTSL